MISQITGLRDLKLGSNNLCGELSFAISSLRSLEVLDLRNNQLTSLPESIAELTRLRILDVSQNGLRSLPLDILQQLPLTELSASKNKLAGVLAGVGEMELPQLQILDVSVNSLTSLTVGDLRLPSLHQLSCSSNRLGSLPNLATWESLLTLSAEDNSIEDLPEGFTALRKIRNVDLSGNNIKVLDNDIGRMESLHMFRISGNPLRERKFSSMTIDDLRKALRARLEPEEVAPEESLDDYTSRPGSPNGPSSSHWPIKPGGILDRSNTQSSSLDSGPCAQVAAGYPIKVLELHHNLLNEIPRSVDFFAATLTTLNLSHNQLTSESMLSSPLELPALKELNLSSNSITSLGPLLQLLSAPLLETLNISHNRLTSLPILRSTFPSLINVLASNNQIADLDPDAVRGLRVLDVSSNDIGSLNARIGLLGGPGGLERLDVSGNRFRVPGYRVLEKGTEATLAWLRDRIPANEVNGSMGETF